MGGDKRGNHNAARPQQNMHNQYNPQGITLAPSQNANSQCDANGNLLVAVVSSSPASVINATSISASGLIKTGAGHVFNVIVSASTSGTLTLWDNTSAAGTKILDTFPLTAGATVQLGGVKFSTGLFATIGGTATITVTYN